MNIYLLCLQLASGECYLELSDKFQLMAWNDMNGITKRFESFYAKSQSSDYETHMSACWGILSFRPYVIKSPGEDAEWIRPYMIGTRAVSLSGGNVRIPNPMMPVDPKILEHSILDICKNVIDTLYGKDV